jgi:hypothetical protein
MFYFVVLTHIMTNLMYLNDMIRYAIRYNTKCNDPRYKLRFNLYDRNNQNYHSNSYFNFQLNPSALLRTGFKKLKLDLLPQCCSITIRAWLHGLVKNDR